MWTLLFNRWTWIILAIAAVGGYVGILKVEVSHYASKVETLEKQVGEWKVVSAEKDAQIARQNTAVEEWKAASVQNAKRALASQQRAAQLAQATEIAATKLLTDQVPNSCEGALTWLKSPEVLQSLSW